MNFRQLQFFLFLFVLGTGARAQDGIGYYYDYTNHLNVFDHGVPHEIESNPVSNIVTGNDYMGYLDSKNSYMVYYDSDKHLLEEFMPSQVVATPYALVYRTQKRLMVCEKGEKRLLSKFAADFYADDSIVVWRSELDGSIMEYSDGKIDFIESGISAESIRDGKTGANLFAYNNMSYDFKIWYKGQVYNTNGTRISNYACGKDIVAFQDDYKNNLSVFYKGETKVISDKIVKSFIVCNELVAFVDEFDNFFIYYKGGLTKIDAAAPDYYFGRQNILCYSYLSQVKIVYNGKIHTEKNILRENIILGTNSVLYINSIDRARYFYKGVTSPDFYIQPPFTRALNGDLPVFRSGENSISFYYDGRTYEYGSRAGSN